jgi:hypothetical protein
MRKVQMAHRFSAFVVLVLFWAGTANASILVGTAVIPSVEKIDVMNDLINDYNIAFSASLPNVAGTTADPKGFLGRIENIGGSGIADFVNGLLTYSDFNFYQQDNGGGTELNIFDECPEKFMEGFGDEDKNVRAFDLNGTDTPSFQYYVSKDGFAGWSLWTYQDDGLNPVYTDSGVSGFTRGDISNTGLAYDPIKHGISHIGFYTTYDVSTIPEPSSLLVFVGLGLSCGAVGLWRKRKQTV